MNKHLLLGGSILAVILIAAIGTLIAKGRSAKSTIDNTTVDTVDWQRYVGAWYEIARFNHPFERNLELVMASYALNPDGTVKVTNSGFNTKTGRYKESVGRARRVEGRDGELEVTFFLNFWSPYKIMELAPDYSYVMIGSDSDKYLWILSRTPRLDNKTIQHLLNLATQRGYNVEKLIWVKQN